MLTVEVGGIRHDLLARTWALTAGVRRPGPVSADRGVDHDIVVVHLSGNIARVAVRERRSGHAPRAGVGVAALDVLRDHAAGEPPDEDAIAVPEMCEDAARLVVERVAERRRVALQVRAAGVRVG